MKAIVKTQSNFKNVNDKELEVVELLGGVISCKVPQMYFDPESGEPVGDMITADFNVGKEVIYLK